MPRHIRSEHKLHNPYYKRTIFVVERHAVAERRLVDGALDLDQLVAGRDAAPAERLLQQRNGRLQRRLLHTATDTHRHYRTQFTQINIFIYMYLEDSRRPIVDVRQHHGLVLLGLRLHFHVLVRLVGDDSSIRSAGHGGWPHFVWYAGKMQLSKSILIALVLGSWCSCRRL